MWTILEHNLIISYIDLKSCARMLFDSALWILSWKFRNGEYSGKNEGKFPQPNHLQPPSLLSDRLNRHNRTSTFNRFFHKLPVTKPPLDKVNAIERVWIHHGTVCWFSHWLSATAIEMIWITHVLSSLCSAFKFEKFSLKQDVQQF